MGHNHSHNVKSIKIAFFLNVGFTVVELVGGLLTNSIAIISDALHDLGDSLSLGLSWWLERFSENDGSEQFTYGYRRFSLLGSLINAVVLLSGSVFVIMEAVPRLVSPQETYSPGMIGLAVFGMLVNGLAVYKLSSGKNENIKVLTWHLLEDVLGWAAVFVGGIIIYFTDFHILDPILSIGITGYILFNVFRRLKTTASIFLQSTPEHIDMAEVIESLMSIDGVIGQHHTHAWSLDGEHHVLTTHLQIEKETVDKITEIKNSVRRLAEELGFSHVTVEVDFLEEDCSMYKSD